MPISRAAKVERVLSDLGRRYLGVDPLKGEGTALAKITAETEDPFKVLIGTILSQRTRDEMTEVASRQLFAKYRTPRSLAHADVRDIERRIRPVGFYRNKARKVREVAGFFEFTATQRPRQPRERPHDGVPRLLRDGVRARVPVSDEVAALHPHDHVRRRGGGPARDHERLLPRALVDAVCDRVEPHPFLRSR